MLIPTARRDVRADCGIEASFKEEVAEDTFSADVALPGCLKNYSTTYSPDGNKFVAEKLTLLNTDVPDDGSYIKLNTGNQAIDPNNIVIPFRQQVAVYFLYEDASYNQTDFGWMEVGAAGSGATKHQIYQDIDDFNNHRQVQ